MITPRKGIVTLVVMFTLCAHAVGAQTFKPVDTPVVVDAIGKEVGGVVASFKRDNDSTPTNAVALEVGGRVVRVNITRTDFSTTNLPVFFESPDCSGASYVKVDDVNGPNLGEDLTPVSIVQTPGRTVYLVDPTATPTERLFNSFLQLNSGSPAGCQRPFSFNYDWAIPALALGDLLSAFTPPFRVVPSSPQAAAACCGDCNRNGHVTVDELVTSVNNALTGCPAPSTSAQP